MTNLGSDNGVASVQGEDVADKGLILAQQLDHVGNLDDAVVLGFREDALPAGALNVETENPQGRHFTPFALGWMGDQVFPFAIHFDLAA